MGLEVTAKKVNTKKKVREEVSITINSDTTVASLAKDLMDKKVYQVYVPVMGDVGMNILIPAFSPKRLGIILKDKEGKKENKETLL